jgi:hypothetical protein
MTAAPEEERITRQGVQREAPKAGTDTFIVTHMPNIAAAYPDDAKALADGEALVFHPDGKGGAELVAHIKIDDWAQLAH